MAFAAVVACGCDPTFAIVAHNGLDRPVLIGRYQSGRDGRLPADVIVVGPNGRVTLGTYGVGSVLATYRVVVMDEHCDVIGDEALEGFAEGGVIEVALSGVSLAPGHNPPSGDQATVVQTCLAALPSVEP